MSSLDFMRTSRRSRILLLRRSSAFAKTCIAIAMLTLVVSCSSKATKSTQERIEEEVVVKLRQWKSRRAASCRKQAMEIALVNADSMILDYAREQKLQLERPSKPIRPEEPELRRPNDTLRLEPFLKDSM